MSVQDVASEPSSLSVGSVTSFEVVKGGAYCYKCGQTFTYQYWYMHEGSCDFVTQPMEYGILSDYDE